MSDDTPLDPAFKPTIIVVTWHDRHYLVGPFDGMPAAWNWIEWYRPDGDLALPNGDGPWIRHPQMRFETVELLDPDIAMELIEAYGGPSGPEFDL